MIKRKVWKAGTGTLVISIPKWLRELQGIKEGDHLELDPKGIYHIPKKQNRKTEEKQK